MQDAMTDSVNMAKNSAVANFIRTYSNIHIQGDKPNIFLFSTPRSGSTWLKELLYTQPGMKYFNEPFNIRTEHIRKYLKVEDWADLYEPETLPRIQSYLNAIVTGKKEVGFRNAFPFKDNYRLITKRIVFKVLHACEDRINFIRDEVGGKMLVLLRHPIPVSLSREYYPRLEAFLDTAYNRHFTDEQLAFARNIVQNGSKLEKGVLSWCLQNMVPLRDRQDDWVVLTYEQLTLNPAPIIDLLCDVLELDDPEKVKANLNKPSGSTHKSDKATQERLKAAKKTGDDDRTWMVEKWRKKVNEEEEAHLMEILKVFDIDAYEAGSFLPNQKYWIDYQPAK
ncbi:sulfotransferase domain-containing protein [Pontibacter sp. G13]|uniref:sulfotransferase domain-containing protein n=1 Tax=Pontibacter sp. G13 TaxID=3074898 RepID=UPI002889E6AB|nr:sulfotransferase domain-containing protein [Pontibacter sp. G13]WNJ19754.1 sulfotransferase domain-containing protein [Pontibacter sp. G13]